ncbi:MAG: hypothetical protein JRF63_05825 [Deltaproteobacteria bacterium]|nr:hypothetical protein [Deltaproteobacteria bacterium]
MALAINAGIPSTGVQRLLDRVHKSGGAPAVASVLIETASASAWFKYGTRGESTGDWRRNFGELTPDQMRAVQDGLNHALESSEVNWRLTRNALLTFPANDQAETAKLVAAAKKLLEQQKEPPVALAVREVALRAASTKPADAAALVCGILGGRWARDDADLLVLAATGAKCEHALQQISCERLLEGKGCGEADTWRPCDKAKLEQTVAAEFEAWKRSESAESRTLERGDYLLAIARSHNALPAELEAATRLRGYKVEQPEEPKCSNYMIKQDMPCKCWHFATVEAPSAYRSTLCEAAAKAPEEPFTTKASDCRIEIDDKSRTIKVLGFKRLTGAAQPATAPDAATRQ